MLGEFYGLLIIGCFMPSGTHSFFLLGINLSKTAGSQTAND